jgi:hypothetical protein
MQGIESATWIMAIATCVMAIVTFLAVLVALFREDLVSIWRRPILDLRLQTGPPDCQKTPLISINGGQPIGDAYYFRLWVFNDGRLRAEDVQIFAASLIYKMADRSFEPVRDFLPMNLVWSHSLTSKQGPEIFAKGISPEMGKHCDLGFIEQPHGGDDLCFALAVEAIPNTGSHKLKPGIYKLELKVAASNSKPVTKYLEMNITGKWSEDENKMLKENIGMTLL